MITRGFYPVLKAYLFTGSLGDRMGEMGGKGFFQFSGQGGLTDAKYLGRFTLTAIFFDSLFEFFLFKGA